jgi:hypothetical protein
MRTIYVDTSVFGGKFDAEFELWTELFFEKVFDSDLQLIRVYSDKLLDGSGRGSQVVQTAGDEHDSVAHIFGL